MKQLFLAALMLIGFCAASAAERLVIVDGVDRGPVVGATVMSRSGLILGITDADGRINGLKPSDFPLEIRSLGYEPMSVAEVADTISLQPAVYPLSEISVTPGDRPICRVVCYERGYSTCATSTDTTQIYAQFMTESFIADGKLKGYKSTHGSPKLRNKRLYARFTNSDGLDSVGRPEKDDYIALMPAICITFLQIFPGEGNVVEEPQAINDGAVQCITYDKHKVETKHKRMGDLYIQSRDPLTAKKNHTYSPLLFKTFGCTIDFNIMETQYAFRVNNSGKYEPGDLVYGTNSIGMLGRGKLFKVVKETKDPIELNGYLEFYPVEVSYHTVDEYKEMIKNPSKIEFKEPENLLPLPPAIAAIVERIENADQKK